MIIKFAPKTFRSDMDMPLTFHLDTFDVGDREFTLKHPQFGAEGLSFENDDFSPMAKRWYHFTVMRILASVAAAMVFSVSFIGMIMNFQNTFTHVFLLIATVVFVLFVLVHIRRQVEAALYGGVRSDAKTGMVEIIFQSSEERDAFRDIGSGKRKN